MANFRENTPTVVAMTAENFDHRGQLTVVKLTTTFVNERFMCRCAEQLFIKKWDYPSLARKALRNTR